MTCFKMHSAACAVSMHDGCPLQIDINYALVASPEQLAGKAACDRLYLNYNSVDVTIDNNA